MKSNYYVEQRTVNSSAELCADIAHHLMTRYKAGPVAIVVDKPFSFFSPLRKSWLHLTKTILIDRAQSLEMEKIRDYSYFLGELRKLSFTVTQPERINGVVVITPEDCMARHGDTTLYLACKVSKSDLKSIVNGLSNNAVIIDYAQQM